MPTMMTRVDTGDFDAWKPMFDEDPPNAREKATAVRLFRSVENPNEVFVQVEFASQADALEARERLHASGVLKRVQLLDGPTLVDEIAGVS